MLKLLQTDKQQKMANFENITCRAATLVKSQARNVQNVKLYNFVVYGWWTQNFKIFDRFSDSSNVSNYLP